ncbi:MAG: alpha/beta fold hydrolase [Acidimicrobiales bacterium]|nr:alpha/beta fold hydrolase [Acidimicrobiales bacterium]
MNLMSIDGVRVVAAGSGPTVVCLGGLGAGVASWEPVWNELGEFRRVAFDPPGVDGSPRGERRTTIAEITEIACTLLDELASPVTVVGYSFGGAVAQELARRRPHQVASLVLVATSTGWGSVPGPLPAALASQRWPRGRAAIDQAVSFLGWTSLPWLARLRTPTWVVVGSADVVVPAVNGWMMSWLLPAARLRVVPADHDGLVTVAAPAVASIIREAVAVQQLDFGCAR